MHCCSPFSGDCWMWTTSPAALHVVTPPGALRPARVTALIEFLTRHFREAPWAYGVPSAAD